MKGQTLAEANLGKVIEKIIGKIIKEEAVEETKGGSSKIPLTSEPFTSLPASTSTTTPKPTPSPTLPKKVYLKALSLHSLDDLVKIKAEIESGNIMIVKIGPLTQKSVEDVKKAVSELSEFVEKVGGDIARLGEDRVVVTPSFVKIWREPPQQRQI
jgi:SepF-like predicted cell division protein (DUF552 family)